jgi:uncharacterized membrane protein YphA (DoxX/SURF4 family)
MRLAVFRFLVLYFTFYALATQIAGGMFLLPGFALPALGHLWPLRDVTLWLAEHVFGLAPPFVYVGNSGDTAFHWVQTAWLVAASLVGAAIWSALDRRDRDYATLHAWFRLFLRFAVAAQMFYYGMAKIIPSQFPPPALVTLVTPVGNLSLSDLLWTFIGSSTPYQVFTGVAETLAGILLLTPRTTPLGAIIAIADMIQVFVLNMTYDFGLKQISFHLLLMSAVLLAPDLRRIANVLVLNRPAPPSTEPPLFHSARANRRALAAQIAFGLYLMAMFANVSWRFYRAEGGPGAPKSPLYGIWDIHELSIDGETRPAVMNDYDRRWRRVIFDAPHVVVFQRTDDSFAHFRAALDERSGALTLGKGTSRLWRARFAVERPAQDQLVLEGTMDERRIRMRLQRVGLDTFRLLNSTFRWVRPPDPYAG